MLFLFFLSLGLTLRLSSNRHSARPNQNFCVAPGRSKPSLFIGNPLCLNSPRRGLNPIVKGQYVYCAAHSLCVAKRRMIKRIMMKMKSAFHFP